MIFEYKFVKLFFDGKFVKLLKIHYIFTREGSNLSITSKILQKINLLLVNEFLIKFYNKPINKIL